MMFCDWRECVMSVIGVLLLHELLFFVSLAN